MRASKIAPAHICSLQIQSALSTINGRTDAYMVTGVRICAPDSKEASMFLRCADVRLFRRHLWVLPRSQVAGPAPVRGARVYSHKKEADV